MLRGFGVLSLLLFCSLSVAQTSDTCLSASEIQDTIKDFKYRIQPLLKNLSRPVEIKYQDIPLLDDAAINGSSNFMSKDKIQINIFGKQCLGSLYKDELRLLLCHELGHVAGGGPHMAFLGHDTKNEVSAEGQADFFATSSCLPNIFASEDNTPYLKEALKYPELKELCPSDKSDQERGLCMRTYVTSLNFAKFLYQTPSDLQPFSLSASADAGVPSFSNKDQTMVSKTLLREYPSEQCRLETFMAGFQCQAIIPFSNFTTKPESLLGCGEKAVTATRPACWYKAD